MIYAMPTIHDPHVPGALTAIDAMIMQRIPPRTQFIYAHAAIRDARLCKHLATDNTPAPAICNCIQCHMGRRAIGTAFA